MSRRTLLLVSALISTTIIAGCSGDPITTPTDGAADGVDALDSRLAAVESRLDAISAQLTVIADDSPSPFAPEPGVVQAIESDEPGVVNVTVSGLRGYDAGDLAGVVQRDSDGLVVGGFGVVIDGADFTTTQPIRRADTSGSVASWPPVTDEILIAEPGRYVLFLWADTGLGAYSRWFPLNTDGRGLIGCVQVLDVIDGMATEVTVDGALDASGFGGVCNAPPAG